MDAGAASLALERLGAPVAELYLQLALACRSGTRACREAGESVEAAWNEGGTGEVLAVLVGPNALYAARQRAALSDLTDVGRAAIALRKHAAVENAYPERLEALRPDLRAARGELPGLLYERTTSGGARLILDEPLPWNDSVAGAERLRGLARWELPPPAGVQPSS